MVASLAGGEDRVSRWGRCDLRGQNRKWKIGRERINAEIAEAPQRTQRRRIAEI
jgi:hypothetical protein